jgi:hypothetical protein
LKRIFLCHNRDDAEEVGALATALRLHGISPWVDQQGGFSLGDGQLSEARRGILEDCFGLLLYATSDVFDSDFIRRVEVEAALEAKDRDARFLLAALPRGLGFKELSVRSLETFGIDLSGYASHRLGARSQKDDVAVLQRGFRNVANELTMDRLRNARDQGIPGQLQLQYSTRERLADERGDVLCIDAAHVFADRTVADGVTWRALHESLLDIKRAIAVTLGRPKLRVHGSKHLTAAFLLGHVFPSTTFDMEVRTRQGYWSTSLEPLSDSLLEVDLRGGVAGSGVLHVELSTLDQPVQDAVRRYIRRAQTPPYMSLRLTAPRLVTERGITNAVAVSLAAQIRTEIAQVVASKPITEIHLFASVPQALATMIGRRVNAFPPVQLYEYDGREYHPSYLLQSVPDVR